MGVLTISGSRSIDQGKGSKYSSTFTKSIHLDPIVDGEKITANLQNGVLVVSAPKHMNKVEESVKSIPITEIVKDENIQDVSDDKKDYTGDNTAIKVSNKDVKKG